MELREKIVAACVAHFDDPKTTYYEELADAILQIPEIKEALALLSQKRRSHEMPDIN